MMTGSRFAEGGRGSSCATSPSRTGGVVRGLKSVLSRHAVFYPATRTGVALAVAIALGFTLLVPPPGFAQESPIFVNLVPFYSGDDAALDPEAVERLEQGVVESLNRNSGVRIVARLLPKDSLDRAARRAGLDGNRGRVGNRVLEELRVPGDTVGFWLLGEVRRDGGELIAEIEVLTDSLRYYTDFRVVDSVTDLNPLADQIADRLALNLGKNIRIAVTRFPMTGGDTLQYGLFSRGLPSMLTTALNLSSRLVLLESFGRDSLVEATNRSLRNAGGIEDRRTALETGRQLGANYYIMGEFWEWNGEIRVDIRCVNIQSREIVAVRGITMNPEDISAVEERMTRLANELRAVIERDFVRRESSPRYVAVAGYPPYPSTGENRLLLGELVRTVTRKLRALNRSDFRVREDPGIDGRFLEERRDRWLMSSELDADVLVTLSLDRTDPDRLVVDYEFFDTSDPENLVSDTELGSLAEIDAVVDTIVSDLLAARELVPGEEERDRMAEIGFRGLHRRWSWRIRAGPGRRIGPSLFMDSTGGLTLDGGPLWIPDREAHWHIEPMNLRFDILASRRGGERIVVGGDVMVVSTAYRFRPHRAYNPYAGVSLGFLGVFRRWVGGLGYDATPGMGVLVGLEQTLGSARKVNYEIEITSGFSDVSGQALAEDEDFPSGRPGGLYLTVGMQF